MNPLVLDDNTLLCDNPYRFGYHVINGGAIQFDIHGKWTLLGIDGSVVLICENGMEYDAYQNIAITSHGHLTVSGKGCFFILSAEMDDQASEYISVAEAYRVIKPWGQETWITGSENTGYCLKLITINAGHQTSLQYHEKKTETNVLLSGSIELIGEEYRKTIHAPAYVNITPMTVHRIRALSDITLIEASTAHLDDVIRIEDDTNRDNGKILKEHPSPFYQ